jgi:hypothetical protein
MKRILLLLLLAVRAAGAAEPAADGFAKLLAAHVTPSGEIAFRSLDRGGRQDLARYLDSLAATDPARLEGDGAVAFWLNAYHALMLSAVTHGENPAELEGRARMFHWFGHSIAGKRQTLDELRAILDRFAAGDARIHLAISNGTRGGPALPVEPFVADRLDAQLASAARRFASDPRNVRIGHGGLVELSRVFEWYRKDFERTSGTLARFLRPLVADSALLQALAVDAPAIVFVPYDWDLAASAGERPR